MSVCIYLLFWVVASMSYLTSFSGSGQPLNSVIRFSNPLLLVYFLHDHLGSHFHYLKARLFQSSPNWLQQTLVCYSHSQFQRAHILMVNSDLPHSWCLFNRKVSHYHRITSHLVSLTFTFLPGSPTVSPSLVPSFGHRHGLCLCCGWSIFHTWNGISVSADPSRPSLSFKFISILISTMTCSHDGPSPASYLIPQNLHSISLYYPLAP